MVTCSYSCYGVYFNCKVDNHYSRHLVKWICVVGIHFKYGFYYYTLYFLILT